ncbi:MAG: SAM-dependent methyltransferase [Alphaproteobacteria bacterium]|nr:MAG: SAM-dependent methyltransferase [Alphaproteobacteria bacterium]
MPPAAPDPDWLARWIAHQGGVVRLDAFMRLALSHPEYGYYCAANPIGRDFVTAPELSGLFGAAIGLALARLWQEQGCPSPFILAELGPGRGRLMADMLAATRAMVPGFVKAAHIHLVEISPVLRDVQRQALTGFNVVWHDTCADLPDGPLWLVANEFFDALPIRQILRGEDGAWRERLVTVDSTTDALSFALGPADPRLALLVPEDIRAQAPIGWVVELCPAAQSIALDIAARIAHKGGAALIVDYGYTRPSGASSLRAIHRGEHADVLTAPGQTDISAGVDFAALTALGQRSGAQTSAVLTQAKLLSNLGVQGDIHHALRRLCGTDSQAGEMGGDMLALAYLPSDLTRIDAFCTTKP